MFTYVIKSLVDSQGISAWQKACSFSSYSFHFSKKRTIQMRNNDKMRHWMEDGLTKGQHTDCTVTLSWYWLTETTAITHLPCREYQSKKIVPSVAQRWNSGCRTCREATFTPPSSSHVQWKVCVKGAEMCISSCRVQNLCSRIVL